MSRLWPLFLPAILCLPSFARAQPEPGEPTVITLRPADEPDPALKYRILPERRELVPGNAAVFYHRAIQKVMDIRYRLALQNQGKKPTETKSPEADIADWASGPLEKIPVEKARQQLSAYQNALHEVELGAIRKDCDWEFDLREETFDLLMPEIQEMRSLGRLVALRVRLAVLDGKTDEAVHWLQTGYAMCRHVGEGPTMIQSLVGVAIASQMNRTLEDLIQGPGTPSLFWAIAERPEPFIDIRPAIESERILLERYLPGLDELDGPAWSLERARMFIQELQEKLVNITNEPAFNTLMTTMGLTLMVAKQYPEAKRTLIDEGRSVEQVEAMPSVQVVALVAIRRYHRLRDDSYKWLSLPYAQSYMQFDDTLGRGMAEAKAKDVLLTLFAMLLPAIEAARMSEVRLDRQLAALQTIEAIRLHAAAHDGALPTSLDDLSDAPPPLDPATGKPFSYEVDGDTARLTAPLVPGSWDDPVNRINYELRLK